MASIPATDIRAFRAAPANLRSRRRGAILVEAALAVGVVAGLVALTFTIVQEQQRRSESALLGSEKREIMLSARNFLRNAREDVLADLFGAATAGGAAAVTYELDDLSAAGFLSTALQPGGIITRSLGQDYALVVRAVFQDDTDTPPQTLTEADMDPFGTGEIAPNLIDGDLSNGEIGIEAVLLSRGGDPAPPNILSRIVEQTGLLNAGFISAPGRASGALGAMQFDISGFTGVDAYTQSGPGRLASPIAIGSEGILLDGAPAAADLRDAFLRCADLESSDPGRDDCIADQPNATWSNIVIRNFNSADGSTNNPDTFPAIDGLTRLRCADPLGDLADPVDPDVFLIDCTTTQLSGDVGVDGGLSVAGDVAVGGDLAVDGDAAIEQALDVQQGPISLAGQPFAERRTIGPGQETVLSGQRVALRLPDSTERDLSETVFDVRTVAARSTFPVHQCPLRTLDGSNLLAPRATAQIAAIADPWGRPIAGAWANVERGDGDGSLGNWTQDPNGSRFLVRIRYVIPQDRCDASFQSPVPTTDGLSVDSDGQPTFGSQCAAGNGNADVYEIHPRLDPPVGTFAAATVTLRCY